MKNLIKYMFPAILLLLGFSCDKSEPRKTDDKCGDNTAKFIKKWCPDDIVVVEILFNESMGEDWTSSYGKTYHHAVLAKLESTLLGANGDWSRVIGSSDSVFYFNYVLEQGDYGLACKVCCPPTKNILITSLASRQCPTVPGN